MNGDVPICWDWSIDDVIKYINRKEVGKAHHLHNDSSTNHNSQLSDATEFDDLVKNILLFCLQKKSIYAYRTDSEALLVKWISFHYKKDRCQVPILDVFTALEWFISFVEDSSSDATNVYQI